MATGLHKRPVIGQTSVRAEGSTKCLIHRNKEFVFVCSDCNELICTTCCVSGHRNHTLEETTDVNSRQKGKLLDFVNDTEENKLPELQKVLQLIQEKEAETEHNLGTVLPGQMQQRGKMCKIDIDRYISQLESSCQKKKNMNIELLQAYKDKIHKRYARLIQMTKECKQVLQSGTPVLVFDKFKDVECLKREPLSMPVLCTAEYKPGTDNPQHTQQAIGTLDTCTPKYKPGTDNPQHIQQVKETLDTCTPKYKPGTDNWQTICLRFIVLCLVIYVLFIVKVDPSPTYIRMHCTKMATMVPTPDGSVWFSDKKSNITQILHDGTTKRSLNHRKDIQDISLSPKTDSLWLILDFDRHIYELTPPSFLPHERFHRLDLMFNAICLHVTNEDNLVIGSLHDLEIFTNKGIVRHKAVDVSLQYMVPWQITECPVTGNLAVVRVLYEMNPLMSDIAVYDKALNVLLYYNMSGAAWNLAVAYDSFGNIVIGDSRTQTVYMISGTGQYIKHLFNIIGELRSIAIQTPCNILWVAVQQNNAMNRKEVKIAQKRLDLPNPSNECKQLRKNVLKSVYETTKDRERKCYFSFIKDILNA